MPRPCSVCSHDERSAIDRALVGGTSFRDVAGQFDLTKSAVARHHADHLPAKLVKAEEAETVADADKLLAELGDLQRRALSILDDAETAGDLPTALRAIGEARRNLELLARLLGELKDGPTVNVHIAPQWVELRTTILQVLEPYPEARTALAAAVGEGAGHAGG